MKIVHVAEWNELSGGAYTVVNNLVRCTSKIDSNIEIHIVSFADTNEILYMDGYTVHLVKGTFFPTSSFWYSHNVLKGKIMDINPDLVHLHFAYPPYSLLTKLPFPVVITTHGLSSIKVKGSHAFRSYLSLSTYLNPLFEKKGLIEADSIIAVSKWIKKKVELIIGPNTKTVYIPNGVDISTFKHVDVEAESALTIHPSIFFVGRLIKFKGVDILINSLYYVKKDFPQVHLYVAGDGPQLPQLKGLVSHLNLETNITFLGYLSEIDKQMFLHESDIFVIPSRYETFGIVVLEALKAGTPIVASKVGGIPDILGDGDYGILFNPEDVQDLARCITSLLSDSELQKELSEKGLNRVLDYSWDDIAKDTLDLYSSLVAR